MNALGMGLCRLNMQHTSIDAKTSGSTELDLVPDTPSMGAELCYHHFCYE